MLVDVFLIVGYDRLRNRLSYGVDLRDMSTTGDSHSDVDLRELVNADDEERFVDLVSKHFRLH